ncbi:MAG TPA: SigE family RNA polymerase sigma factor [Mycobacteriales bacterium]|nr:SigE family RNA polymerase sigma factor [Mycobacteriales bacterium]
MDRRAPAVDPRLGDYVRGQWPALVRYATALCGSPSEAEELVQSALVRVALRWPFVRDKDNPDGYVRRAVLNAYLNVWRRVRSRETSMAEVPDAAGVDATAGVAEGVALRAALQQLPARQRAVLVLRYLEDRSETETADLLGCSVGTVKSQTSKGLAKLRRAVGLPDDVSDLHDGTAR